MHSHTRNGNCEKAGIEADTLITQFEFRKCQIQSPFHIYFPLVLVSWILIPTSLDTNI